MATISLGSGSRRGRHVPLPVRRRRRESERVPRHTHVLYGEVGALQQQIRDERVRALTAFRDDVLSGGFRATATSAESALLNSHGSSRRWTGSAT